ncbi:putative O-antigen transporter [bioreactor metagenome]|uniref:Putative O-antigen transporter n=1 Tax=bioreactor metagenome TaxID=1076179 RepID=A0A644UJQ1_9ZZZZ
MGIKKNFIYNSILTISQYIIGLITFPYITRILGASNIGTLGFVDNTINYFGIFATLGISIIGTREIARNQKNKEKLEKIFSSLIIIIFIYTCITLLLYLTSILLINKLNIHKELFFIGSAKLIFLAFSIDWLFKGFENFKLIAIRNITIKGIYVILIYIFIKNKEDYVIYYILTVSTVGLNTLVNLYYSKKFIPFKIFKTNLKPYFKESINLGAYSILTSTYTTFNVMYLGLVSNTLEVGYYWTSLTIYSIILGFFSAFTSVMMPRMSNLISIGDHDMFNHLIERSFNILFSICFPIMIGSVILSPEIIHVLTGSEFAGAITPMRIIMLLIVVVGIAQILAIQVLVPMKFDKIILKASIMGALIGLICNIILVKKYGAIGTAFVLLISELSVTSIYIINILRNKTIQFPWKSLVTNFCISIPIAIICISCQLLIDYQISIIVVAFFASLLYYILANVILIKNKELIYLTNKLKAYFNKN